MHHKPDVAPELWVMFYNTKLPAQKLPGCSWLSARRPVLSDLVFLFFQIIIIITIIIMQNNKHAEIGRDKSQHFILEQNCAFSNSHDLNSIVPQKSVKPKVCTCIMRENKMKCDPSHTHCLLRLKTTLQTNQSDYYRELHNFRCDRKHKKRKIYSHIIFLDMVFKKCFLFIETSRQCWSLPGSNMCALTEISQLISKFNVFLWSLILLWNEAKRVSELRGPDKKWTGERAQHVVCMYVLRTPMHTDKTLFTSAQKKHNRNK